MCPETDLLKRLVESSIDDEMNAARRRGKSGDWCYQCGHESSDLAPCECYFPSEFNCARLKSLCQPCRVAHRKVASHLNELFNAKRLAIYRADSRRSRLWRFLRDALETLSENGDVEAKTLRSLLGQSADPRADEPSEFRAAVLDSFSRARFSDFCGLAAAIAHEDRIFYATKIAISPIWRL